MTTIVLIGGPCAGQRVFYEDSWLTGRDYIKIAVPQSALWPTVHSIQVEIATYKKQWWVSYAEHDDRQARQDLWVWDGLKIPDIIDELLKHYNPIASLPVR